MLPPLYEHLTNILIAFQTCNHRALPETLADIHKSDFMQKTIQNRILIQNEFIRLQPHIVHIIFQLRIIPITVSNVPNVHSVC